MLWMTYIGYGLPIYLMLLLDWFLRADQLKVLVRIFYQVIVVYCMTNLKLVYMQPRPYMIDPSIRQLGCE